MQSMHAAHAHLNLINQGQSDAIFVFRLILPLWFRSLQAGSIKNKRALQKIERKKTRKQKLIEIKLNWNEK